MNWKWLLGFVFGWLVLLAAGCLKPDMEPIERSVDNITAKVIQPAVAKMTDELSGRTAQLQGQGSLINPGYRVAGYAGMFNGAIFDFNLNATGVSANLAGAAQGDAGQAGSVPPPAMRIKPDEVQAPTAKSPP